MFSTFVILVEVMLGKEILFVMMFFYLVSAHDGT